LPLHGLTCGTDRSGVHQAYPLSNLSTVLQRLLPLASAIHIDLPSPSPKAKRSFLASLLPTQGTMGELEAIVGKVPTSLMRPLAERVQRLRRIKSDAEVAIMRRAGEISSKAHAEVMHFASSSRSEADLEAHFQYVCSLEGSERPAYIPVVASGANALVIHYTRNDQRLQDGEVRDISHSPFTLVPDFRLFFFLGLKLVLIDAGCELHSYCSDITRTFPVSGTFTSAQRDLYEAVLTVNKRCIAMCEVPQRWSSNALHRHSEFFECRFFFPLTSSRLIARHLRPAHHGPGAQPARL
jgi:intermediate cleaving peptidase 55